MRWELIRQKVQSRQQRATAAPSFTLFITVPLFCNIGGLTSSTEGLMEVNMTEIPMEEIELKFSKFFDIEFGGHWEPKDCRPRWKVGPCIFHPVNVCPVNMWRDTFSLGYLCCRWPSWFHFGTAMNIFPSSSNTLFPYCRDSGCSSPSMSSSRYGPSEASSGFLLCLPAAPGSPFHWMCVFRAGASPSTEPCCLTWDSWRPWRTWTGTAWSSMMLTIFQRMTGITMAVVRCHATSPPDWTNTCTCECVIKLHIYVNWWAADLVLKHFLFALWHVELSHMTTAIRLRLDSCLFVFFSLPYSEFFGGVSGLTVEQFRKINGFPNAFWGWGGEDDDLWNRLVSHRAAGRTEDRAALVSFLHFWTQFITFCLSVTCRLILVLTHSLPCRWRCEPLYSTSVRIWTVYFTTKGGAMVCDRSVI